MASLTIRRLDDAIKARLRIRAAHNGRSMEEEAREILKAELVTQAVARRNLTQSIRQHIDATGGVDLALPRRPPVRRPPNLGK